MVSIQYQGKKQYMGSFDTQDQAMSANSNCSRKVHDNNPIKTDRKRSQVKCTISKGGRASSPETFWWKKWGDRDNCNQVHMFGDQSTSISETWSEKIKHEIQSNF